MNLRKLSPLLLLVPLSFACSSSGDKLPQKPDARSERSKPSANTWSSSAISTRMGHLLVYANSREHVPAGA
jgi:hypothetical protein